MAKEKDEQKEELTLEDDSFKIENWDDWFRMCGSITEPLKEYQEKMHDFFFDYKYSEEESADAQKEFQSKHPCGWYEEESKLSTSVLKKIFIGGIVGFGVGFVLGLVLHLLNYNLMNNWIVMSIIFGIIGAVVVVVIVWQIRASKVRKLFKKFAKIEDDLKDKICYIPPKYRNAQSVAAFYDVYCSYGIASFNKAVDSVDDYLVSNNLLGAYMALMFDAPYSNSREFQTEDGGFSDSAANDPALPDDIETKVHEGVDDPEKRLNELIGLENVKTQVRQMKNRMDFYGGDNSERVSGSHMVFLGPPGTGKTTIARIITKILYDFGYIKRNQCIEIDGGYLKSPYVGQTTARANAIINYAMGGVLFIDEAYILTEDRNNSQGAEAVGILLKALEDHRNDFVCIMAGYEDNMNRMLASNEGFASRIKYKVYFENFTTDELCQIFEQLMETSGTVEYSIESDAMDELRQHFAKERKVPGFGNARVVRNTWDALLDIHADLFQTGQISEDKRYTITKEDVDEFVGKRQKQMTEDGRNFIASRNLDSSVISLQELKGKTKAGSVDPDKDMSNLIGLSVVKEEVAKMKAQFEFYDGDMENNGNHMVFFGPPGTGKTTVAGIITGYLYQMGIIRENAYLDINGDFLRGMYLGHTGKRTEAVVQYAQGMVLFVDEAYLLTSNDGSADSFGQEAVGVLIDAMEKYRKDFVVIFAGYEKEMQDFLDVNSGLESRISLKFHFESYSPHELAEMFKKESKESGFTVAKDVWIPMQKYFKTQVSDPKFGNGRFVRQFFDSVKKQHIVNYANGTYGEEGKYKIYLQDIEPLIGEDKNEA